MGLYLLKYKKKKQLLKVYNNKIFSYKNIKKQARNFSRKDFSNTWNNRVIFKECFFEETNFTKSKIENCLFENCKFENCIFIDCDITSTTFGKSIFKNVLFNDCTIKNSLFESNIYVHTLMYPTCEDKYNFTTSSNIKYTKNEEDNIIVILNQMKSNASIRNSKSLFHTKKRMNRSKKEKQLYKKITPKEAEKLGLSKKERLETNRARKKARNIANKEYTTNTALGKHSTVRIGSLRFLMNLYSFDTLSKGLEYANEKMNKKNYSLSYLMKLIDEGNNIKKDV